MSERVVLKTADEIAIMREAGRIVAKAHQAMREAVRPGVSTLALDTIAETVLRDHGGIPSFKGYPKRGAVNYPATINASINSEVIHGIPSADRILQEGDVISLDVGCTYQGFIADAAFTMGVGQIPASVQRLLEVTEQALYLGIKAAVLPNSIKTIATTIQDYVQRFGYGLIRDYTGHGVGRSMHEAPEVPNWWAKDARRYGFFDVPLQVGMTFAIEPMVSLGRGEVKELKDGWTVVTKDGSRSAHFEHTIAITEGEALILTQL